MEMSKFTESDVHAEYRTESLLSSATLSNKQNNNNKIQAHDASARAKAIRLIEIDQPKSWSQNVTTIVYVSNFRRNTSRGR